MEDDNKKSVNEKKILNIIKGKDKKLDNKNYYLILGTVVIIFLVCIVTAIIFTDSGTSSNEENIIVAKKEYCEGNCLQDFCNNNCE